MIPFELWLVEEWHAELASKHLQISCCRRQFPCQIIFGQNSYILNLLTSKRTKKKTSFYVDILKDTEDKNRVGIRYPVVRIRGFRTLSKSHRSGILDKMVSVSAYNVFIKYVWPGSGPSTSENAGSGSITKCKGFANPLRCTAFL
jgi:hypothetical protein